MSIFKSLVLLFVLFNIAFALLPPSPGPIQTDQYTDEPIGAYFSSDNEISLVPLTNGCMSYYSFLDYTPIVVLNESAVLSYQYQTGSPLSIAIITSSGPQNLEVSSELQNLASKSIISPINYDDKFNAYIFINSNNQVVVFDIATNQWSQQGVNQTVTGPQYYDLTKSTYYAVTSLTADGTTYQNFWTLQINSSISNSVFTLYSIKDFNLQVDIKVVGISGYQNSVILFGRGGQLSYLYQLDLSNKSSKLLGQFEYGSSFVSGVNPRYVVVYNSIGSSMQLFDLESNGSSETFSHTCADLFVTGSFLSSIATKDIFTYN